MVVSGAEYVYEDENGAPYIKVSRYYKAGSKCFAQSHWNGTAWAKGTKGLAKDTLPPTEPVGGTR